MINCSKCGGPVGRVCYGFGIYGRRGVDAGGGWSGGSGWICEKCYKKFKKWLKNKEG